MANTILQIEAPTGLTTPKLELYAAGSDTISNGAGGDTLTERTNAKGIYTCTVTEALVGDFDCVLTADATPIGNGVVLNLLDDTATHYVQAHRSERVDVCTLNSDMLTQANVRTAVGLESANLDTQLSTIDDFLDTEVVLIKDLLEADWAVDTTTTPWQVVLIKKSTGGLGVGTELLRQNLKDVSNANITTTTTVIGRRTTP